MSLVDPHSTCKWHPFLFLCVFWGISPSKRTLRHYARGALQLYMFPCSHGNISFLWNEKEARKLKKSCLWKQVLVLMRSPRFENTLERIPSSAPPLREHTHMRTSLTIWKQTCKLAFFCAFLFLNAHSHLLEDIIHW